MCAEARLERVQAAIGGLEQRLRQKLELLDGRAARPTPCKQHAKPNTGNKEDAGGRLTGAITLARSGVSRCRVSLGGL